MKLNNFITIVSIVITLISMIIGSNKQPANINNITINGGEINITCNVATSEN